MKRKSEYIQPLSELMFIQLPTSVLAGSIENGFIEDPNITDWN